MSLYILERPSTWSTSQIWPSCPWSMVTLNLLLDLFTQVYSCLFWPTQYLAVCSNGSHFALDPFLACWRPNTCIQENNTLAPYHIHMDTHIYITLTLLFFILFYTSSTPSGRSAVLDPSRLAHVQLHEYSTKCKKPFWVCQSRPGGQCYEIFHLRFLIKQLLLFPVDMPVKNFVDYLCRYLHSLSNPWGIKGTVARDFLPLLFSIKRTYLGPWFMS